MKYLLRLKNKNYIISGFLIVLLGCLYIITQPKYVSAQFSDVLMALIILIPAFFTSDIFSREYENKSESFIFLTARPIYKQFLERFFAGWIIGEAALFIFFFTAYMTGIESNFLKYFSIAASSTFISLFGVLIGNISKNSMLSYGAIIVLAIIEFSIPISIQQKIIPISLFLNLILKEDILWTNVAYISFFSFTLLLLNLWYVSNGENIRPFIKKTCGILGLLIVISCTFNMYFRNKTNSVCFNIINTKSNKYIIVDSENSAAKKYLKSINLSYIEKQTLDNSDLGKDNLIIIAQEGSSLSENLKSKYKNIERWEYNKEDLRINNIGINKVDCYRTLLKNPNKTQGKIVFIGGRNLNFKNLSILFNKRQGNFLAANDSQEIAKSKYSLDDFDSFNNDISVIGKRSYLIQYGSASNVIYRSMPYEKIHRIAYLWDLVIKAVNEKFPQREFKYPNTVYLYNKKDIPENTSDSISIEIKNIKDFEMPKYFQDKNFVILFLQKTFNDSILKNVNDKVLRDAWSEYYYNENILRNIAENLKNSNYEYSQLLIKFSDSYTDDFNKNTKFFYGNEKLIGANMLHELDNKNVLDSFIKEINSSKEQMDDTNIKQIYEKYAEKNVWEKYINEYKLEKTNTLEYVKKYNLDLYGF